MSRNCEVCGAFFTVETEEAAWLEERKVSSSPQCPRCRAFKEGIQDESIICSECGKVFIYPRELKYFAELFAWSRPRRCIGGCVRIQGAPLSEEEKLVFDFLKRIRSVGRERGGMASLNDMGNRPTRSSLQRNQPSETENSEEVGGSLADALKAFQAKKRRSIR